MPTLKITERKYLKQIGHKLDPVVIVGMHGLTDNVVEETRRALNDHELIKIKVAGEDRTLRHSLIEQLVRQCQAELVQQIGKTALLYKKSPQQNPKLSNLVRYAYLSTK